MILSTTKAVDFRVCKFTELPTDKDCDRINSLIISPLTKTYHHEISITFFVLALLNNCFRSI